MNISLFEYVVYTLLTAAIVVAILAGFDAVFWHLHL